MGNRQNRRTFLKTTTAAGVGYWVAGGVSKAASRSVLEEIRFASIGVDGKGRSDSNDAANSGKMVAICDIDENKLGRAAQQESFKGAKQYFDFRKMFDEMADKIDAVTVSTPDHTHAPASAMALRLGKHCFTQKPLTHTIYEARLLGKLAKEHNVQTMMGNQGTASSVLRKSAALIQGGIIGKVKEVHVWTNRPVWDQGLERPKGEEAPKHIHWKEWIGPAPHRPFSTAYHPFKWRGWWDFGTGALGDMACHTFNMPFAALNLRDPVSVHATTTGHNKDSYPGKSEIVFDFPALGDRDAVLVKWYDGGNRPSRKLLPKRSQIVDKNGKELVKSPGQYNNLTKAGSLIVGEKGTLFSPGDYGFDSRHCGYLIDGKYTLQRDVTEPEVEFKQSPGHFAEYVRAIKEGIPAMSNFPDYAGPLTETILLGNLAVWADGKKIEWDSKNLKATNAPEVQHIVNKEYHNGYKL